MDSIAWLRNCPTVVLISLSINYILACQLFWLGTKPERPQVIMDGEMQQHLTCKHPHPPVGRWQFHSNKQSHSSHALSTTCLMICYLLSLASCLPCSWNVSCVTPNTAAGCLQFNPQHLLSAHTKHKIGSSHAKFCRLLDILAQHSVF